MENKNMTAVEYFWSKIALKVSIEQIDEFISAFEQTKQMEKEQILNARLDGFKISGEGFNGEYPYEGRSDDSISNSINNEQYYNETYNK